MFKLVNFVDGLGQFIYENERGNEFVVCATPRLQYCYGCHSNSCEHVKDAMCRAGVENMPDRINWMVSGVDEKEGIW